MKLEHWMRSHRITGAELARQLGCSQSVLSRVLQGHRLPSGRMLRALWRVTDGAVTPADFDEDEKAGHERALRSEYAEGCDKRIRREAAA